MEIAGPGLNKRVILGVAVGAMLLLSLGGLEGNKLASW